MSEPGSVACCHRFAEGTSRYEIVPAFFQPARKSHVLAGNGTDSILGGGGGGGAAGAIELIGTTMMLGGSTISPPPG
jgi:hypothetical protein